MAISQTKNGGKQSFNAPFSASHLEKTRTSASDFVSWSRTNEKPPVVRRGNPKRMQNRQSSAAATQNVCRTAGHLSLVHLGIHPGHFLRMSGGNSYVFEMSGGSSRDFQQIPSRKRMEIRHSFSNERKTASRREAHRLPVANSRRAGSPQATHSTQAPGRHPRRPTPDRPREAHGAALAIAKCTNTCQPLAVEQNAGYIAAARHRSKWRAAA